MKKAILIILTGIVLFDSCIKEEVSLQDIQLLGNKESGLAAPIGFINFGFTDFFPNFSEFDTIIDPHGFVSFQYKGTIHSAIATDFFHIKVKEKQFTLLNSTGKELSDINFRKPVLFSGTGKIEMVFPENNMIDSIWMKNLSITLFFNAPSITEGTLKITFPEIIIDNLPLSIDCEVNEPITFPITNASIFPNNDYLNYAYELEIITLPGSIPVLSEVAKIDIKIDNLEYKTIFGYFDNITLPLPATNIPMPFFSNFSEGGFHFSDPRVLIDYSNSFGFPLYFEFVQFQFRNHNGISPSLSGIEIPSHSSPFKVPHPQSFDFTPFYENRIVLPTESNLVELLRNSPESMEVAGSIATISREDGGPNFMHAQSRLSTDVAIDIPFTGYFDQVRFTQQFPFYPANYMMKDAENLTQLILRINITNGFPFQLDLDFSIADKNGIILEKLNNKPVHVMAASIKDQNGVVEPVRVKPISIEIAPSQLANIEKGEIMIVNFNIIPNDFDEKGNPEIISMNIKYKFRMDIGIIAGIQTDLSSN